MYSVEIHWRGGSGIDAPSQPEMHDNKIDNIGVICRNLRGKQGLVVHATHVSTTLPYPKVP